ncbi:Diguanylate cyclase [Pararobbsia alpina]|uniref:sensor domain-containing diguanylate cyclase n=1 Tax=Pararobbsia alpina TaxID=621374 RepID=UPI0039A5786C
MVRWSLKSRVVAITVSVLAVLMVLLIFTARHYAYIGLRRLLQEQQDNQVALVATQLDDKFELRARILQALAVHLAPAIEHDPEHLETIARQSVAIPATFDWLLLISPDGQRIFDTRPGIEANVAYSDRDYFQKLADGAPLAISDPVISRATGRPGVIIAVPVRTADGRMVAVLNGGLDLQSKNFLNELSHARPVQSGTFCLVTEGPQATYVMHPDVSRILATVGGAGDACVPSAPRRLWILSPKLGPIVSRHQLRSTHWELIANLPPDEAYSPFTSTRPRLITALAIALVFGALVVYAIVRRLLIPVQHLHRVVIESAHDPAAYKALATTQRGEVGDLARAFASLMRQLTQKTDSLREAGKLAEERKQLIETIANRIPDLVAYLDLNERYVFANRAFESRYGFVVPDMIGRSVREVWGDAMYDTHIAPHIALARSGESSTFDYAWQTPAGTRYFEVVYKPVRDAEQQLVGIHVFSRDVTTEREEFRRLEQTTLVDHLTGLLNRKGFDRRVSAAFERSNDSLRPMALLLVDLDDFKDVNDTHGHACGDRLLEFVGGRLELCVSETDAVARIGGDEFAIVLERDVSVDTIDAIARKIVDSLAQPYDIEECDIRCRASVGAAIHDPRDSSSTNELFMRADSALYAAKHAGKSQYTLFGAAAVRVE